MPRTRVSAGRKAEVLAFWEANPELSSSQVAAHFDNRPGARTLRKWRAEVAGGVAPSSRSKAGPRLRLPATKTPAAELPDGVREQAITIVDASTRLIDRQLQRLLDADGADLDRDVTAALLNLAKMRSQVVTDHPGLLQLVQGEKAKTDRFSVVSLKKALRGAKKKQG